MALLNGATARREFDRFVSDSSPDLLRDGYLLMWNLAEAEDLIQETLFRVAKRWPDVRVMEFPKAYARRILFNLALRENKRNSRIRSQSNGTDSLERVADERFEGRILSIDIHSDIVTALARLPLRQRAVIVLRYYEDLTENEIAEILGWPIGTVKSTASRALVELRKTFSDSMNSPGTASPEAVRSSRGEK
jgi:RNA polymerase sigma-70 factor (sigma-E family)